MLTSPSYDSSTNIDPLQNKQFVFSVSADASEGTYYPTFSLSFRDADSLYSRAVIRVDNTPLELTIIDIPDAFTREKKKTIFVQISNPRKNDVRSVILDVSGTGVTATPDKIFIGNLASGSKSQVNFTVTPELETPLILTLTYNNGNNPHKVRMYVPITFGIDKMEATPVISKRTGKIRRWYLPHHRGCKQCRTGNSQYRYGNFAFTGRFCRIPIRPMLLVRSNLMISGALKLHFLQTALLFRFNFLSKILTEGLLLFRM